MREMIVIRELTIVAGIPMEHAYGSRTGVYSGTMADDYKYIAGKDVDNLPKYTATGTTTSMNATRLSCFYNFQGPSITMDSACSSSLMAFDIACQGLRNRDADMVSNSVPIHELAVFSLRCYIGRCYGWKPDTCTRG